MAKGMYIGDPSTGLAKKMKKLYIGDPSTGVARKVKKVYIGDPNTGLARLCWTASNSVWAKIVTESSMYHLYRSFDRGNTWELLLKSPELRPQLVYGCGGILFNTYTASNGYQLKYVSDNSTSIKDCVIPYSSSATVIYYASTNNRVIVVYTYQETNYYTFESSDGINFVAKNGSSSIGSDYYAKGIIFGSPYLNAFYMPHGSSGSANIWSSIAGGPWTDIVSAWGAPNYMNLLTFFRGTNRFIALNTAGGFYLYTVGLTNFQPNSSSSWTYINKSGDFGINYTFGLTSNQSRVVALFRDISNVFWTAYSSDGINWTKGTSFGAVSTTPKLFFDGEYFVFYTGPYIYSSTDGIAWTAQAVGNSGVSTMAVTVREL